MDSCPRGKRAKDDARSAGLVLNLLPKDGGVFQTWFIVASLIEKYCQGTCPYRKVKVADERPRIG
jgi:hypothetical protein